jgi:hypothetical protein
LNDFSPTAIVDNVGRTTVVDSGGGDPVVVGSQHFVEFIDGSHLVAAGLFGLVVNDENYELHALSFASNL